MYDRPRHPPDGTYLDGTLGGGGHSSEILKALSERAGCTGIDRDQAALDALRRAHPRRALCPDPRQLPRREGAFA
jgi:16S rRNA C1402 N4-methylase RsmH